MNETHQFASVHFHRFKAFEQFDLNLRRFNILVGPNNAGKSTVLVAFRILAAALRKANSKRPEIIAGPLGETFGYAIDISTVSVAEENIFFNYDDSEAASVKFKLSNRNELTLYFPEKGACYLIADSKTVSVRSPTSFKLEFNCPIGFVPILGPVDHNEELFREEAARRALFNYTAARNFRNIWFHYPEKFEVFRRLLCETWPGMDIDPPKIDYSHGKPLLYMFCPEERIPREICWSGFGFQVWCQMLTHLVQSDEKSLFIIDEPDIYLHSDLQRQLLGLLRNLGPDIIIATHSTEIITEAEADDIILINKKKSRARRIKHPSELGEIFSILGSNLNPILTQLAKTRRVIFVEGKDFQVISRFAKKLAFNDVGNRADFAVVPVDGFNPERAKNLKKGMETTLGGVISAAVILDRDYRSQEECEEIMKACKTFCSLFIIHDCKEIENFLLNPEAIDRAAVRKLADRRQRTGEEETYEDCVSIILEEFSSEEKTYVSSQILAARRRFEKRTSPSTDEATSNEKALKEIEKRWSNLEERIRAIPGKKALSFINQTLQQRYKIGVTPTAIIDSMKANEIPHEMRELIKAISKFSHSNPDV